MNLNSYQKAEIRDAKAPCVKCLWVIGFTQREISKQLRVHKPWATSITKTTGIHRNRGKRGFTKRVASVRKKAINRLFREILAKRRKDQLQLRVPLIKAAKRNGAMARYFANHEEAKASGSASALRRYYRIKYTPAYQNKQTIRNAIKELTHFPKRDTARLQHVFSASTQVVRAHIESQFTDGMTWDNHGVLWEIDHRRPTSSFDLRFWPECLKANHFTNLRPLLKWLNRSKAAEQQEAIA